MGMRAASKHWPVILRIAIGIFAIGFLLAFVATVTRSDGRAWFVLLPLAACLLGALMALNIAGAATAMAESVASENPRVVEGSGSLLARPIFARVFGVMLLVVGGALLYAALTQDIVFRD